MKIRLLHDCSIPQARWCEPVGWTPKNQVNGAVYEDGVWWDDDNEVASLVWFGDRDAYGHQEMIEASLDDLRVAASGDCRVIAHVEL